MRHFHSRRPHQWAFWCIMAAVCATAVFWQSVVRRSQAQQPQQDRRGVRVGPAGAANNASGLRRLALVIGNAKYVAAPLGNPANDAQDVAAALMAVGFTLIGGQAQVDVSLEKMTTLVDDFGTQLNQCRRAGACVGVFFYAGHGVQANGRNYLIPVEAVIDRENLLPFRALDANYLLAQMEAESQSATDDESAQNLNIVILDACRNNPFKRAWRDTTGGLAQLKTPAGTLLAFSTNPDNTAADGSGRNSPYTTVLKEKLKLPGVEVKELFNAVGVVVQRETRNKQVPWQSSSPLPGRFCFAGCEVAAKPTPEENKPAPAVVLDRVALERDQWLRIEKSTDPENFKDYLAEVEKGTYPGNYRASARTILRQLEAEAKANAAKPPEVRPTPAPPPVSVPAPTRTRTNEEAFYENAKSASDFCAYLRQYPSGQFTALARSRAGNCFIIPANPPVNTYITSPQTNIELAWIPSGNFLMGSPPNEPSRGTDEGPQKRVTFRQGFWLGRYEVTQAQWRAVMGNLPTKCDYGSLTGEFVGDDKPVICVSWDDAQAFIGKLNAKNDGFTYSLPTEAQWEYAARAETTTPFSFGNNITTDQANYNGNYPYNGAAKGKYLQHTTAVGSYPANGWGLYDMHGNVWEWCQDWYAESYAGTPTDGTSNERTGQYRVERGGSWNSSAELLLSANRTRNGPSIRSHFLGFRVAARVQD